MRIDLDGVEVRTLDLEGVLKTKQSARDRAVLEHALRALKGEPGG